MYINTETKETKEWSELNEKVYREKSIPMDGTLKILDWAFIGNTPTPSYDETTQKVVEVVPELGGDGRYYRRYEVHDLTESELEGRLITEKARKTREINDAYTAEMNALVKEYPETERESWGRQESEARAWLTDNTAPTPFMDAMLTVRTDTTKTQLANKIITKADALADLTGQLTGKRHTKEAEIEAAYLANDQTALENITW